MARACCARSLALTARRIHAKLGDASAPLIRSRRSSTAKDSCWMTPTHAVALRLYRLMRLTRLIEDRVRALYYERRIVGGVYTSRGMEATAVGAADALRPGDVL